MEEYITRAEFEQFKKQVKQMTEPMRAINVNVASQDVITRLDELKQDLTQELKTVSDAWLDTLQEHYTEHKDAISGVQQSVSEVQTVQRGHSKYFEEHGKRLSQMATKENLATMATKDDIRRIEATQEQILKLLQQKLSE
jgi:hypothetical protein